MPSTAADWEPGPARPSLAGAGLDVWRIELAEGPPRERHGAAQGALLAILGRYLGRDPAAIELRRGEHGKPALADAGGLEFNLSHSAGLALVALSAEHPVGVDVEAAERRRRFLALAERWLPPEPARAVREAPPERRGGVFYAEWVRHEARLKCGGGGISGPPPPGPVAVAALPVGRGYAAAVALAAAALPPPRLYRFEPR